MNASQMPDEVVLNLLRPLGVSVHQLTQAEMPGYMDDWGEHRFAEFKIFKAVTKGGDRREALTTIQREMQEAKGEDVSAFYRNGSAVETPVSSMGEPEVYFEISVAFCSTNNDLEALAAAKNSNRQVPVVLGTDFGFSAIPEALEQGFRCRRADWHKDAFIYLVQGSSFTVNRAPLLGIFPEGTEKTYGVHIDMNTGSGTIVPWNIAHESVMARDWEILPRSVEE